MRELSLQRNSLTAEEDQHEKTRFRELLFPLVHQSTFCKYVYDKPRGYAGDFITQEMIWLGRTYGGEHLYNGVSRLGQLVNAATFDMDNCKANVERIYRLQEYIKQAGARIMSIGCGSCIELWALAKDNEKNRDIFLVDQDAGALERARSMINSAPYVKVTHHCANILKFILGHCADGVDNRDLIYLFGLLDYFPIKSAKRLIQALWKYIAPGGLLVATNAHPDNPTKMWMEYVGDWFLDYKDEAAMYDLTAGLLGIEKVQLVKDTQGVYQYLEMRKAVS
jgi:SAM-dependent methyltransferase